jgi:hypothetical protein
MASADFDRAAYHAAAARGERISFHSLMDFVKNGKEYHERITGALPPREETREMFFGSACHKLILEGREAFADEYKVADGPVNPRTGAPYGRETKAFAEWIAQQDKPVVSSDEAAQILLMEKAVRSHEIAAQLLDKGEAETPIMFDWCGLPCQSCLDWINPAYASGTRGAIVDLKTTADLDRFVWQARDFRYIEQLAFYRHALVASGRADNADCYIIGVEKPRANGPAPRCGVWSIPDADLDEAEDWLMQQLNALAEAREANDWRDGYEGLRTLTLHNY